MARWMLTAVLTTTLAGFAAADGEVLTIKTAGQPERRVQVLKTEKTADGKVVQEVRDLASGVVFTLTDSKTLPGTQVPAGGLPQAKPRTADPLLGNKPVLETASPQKQEYPNLMSKLRGPKDAPSVVQPVAQAQPVTQTQSVAYAPGSSNPPQQSKISAALFGNYDQAKAANPTLVSSLKQKPVTAPVINGKADTPTLASKLFGDKPQPVVTQPVNTVKSNIIRPNAVAMTPPPVMVAPVMAAPAPAVKVATAPVVPPPEAKPELVPVKMDAKEPTFPVPPVKTMSLKQIEDLVKELRTNARPTTRLEAADALAASPMASMMEVRQILAEASYRDPVPVVRAHCIEILTKMGYDEFNYKQYVSGLVNDEEPAVQRAARAAAR